MPHHGEWPDRVFPHRWRVLALLGTAFFMTILDGTSLLTALPSIERDLHLAGPAVEWTVTAYALAFSGPLLLCGRAADLFGRRRMFLAGMTLRVLASLLCGLAPSAGLLVAARALQGLSAAVIAPAALSMTTNAFPEGAGRNKALGIWGGIGGFGATAGLLLGGLITSTAGWQWVFWVNVPVGVFVLALAPALLRESRDRAPVRSFDVAGSLTITLALVVLVYAIAGVPSSGWASGRTAGLLAAAIGLTALFVMVEARSAAPLVPVRVLRSPTRVGGNLLGLIAGMAVDGMLITLTTYAQRVLGWSAVRFGLVAAAMTLAAIASALVGQRVATRLGVRRVAAAGTVLLGLACLLLTRVAAGGPLALLLTALPLFGAGMGAAAVCSQIAALTGIAERDSGLAAGLVDTAFAIGTALGVAICSSITLAHAPAVGAPLALLSAQRTAFGAAGAFAALGLITALTLLPGRTGDGPSRHPPGSRPGAAGPVGDRERTSAPRHGDSRTGWSPLTSMTLGTRVCVAHVKVRTSGCRDTDA
jgi:EmrB/QacA subfamily drug resistance transporter